MVMMRNLSKALVDIDAMRMQMARSSEFRGFGPATLAGTAVLAVIASLIQARYVPEPAADVRGYLAIWIVTAALAVVLIGVEMVVRSRRVHIGLADEMIRLAAEQLMPALVVGTLLTCILFRYAPQDLWLLPGLWQILLSLGVFATSRSVPRPMVAVGYWYMVSGLTAVAIAQGANAFSPLAMGIPFGCGQMLAAAILRCTGGSNEEIA